MADADQRVADARLGALVAGGFAGEQLQVAGDHLQQVVEVVGDAAGQLAHRLHLLGLAQRLLGTLRSAMASATRCSSVSFSAWSAAGSREARSRRH